jgi:lipid-A-disaccharide synthase-like uncharacterized protein
MGDRVKMIATFALLGFVAGIVANFTGKFVIPWLSSFVLPNIGMDWVLSGVAGALITIGLVTAWAYMTGPEQ